MHLLLQVPFLFLLRCNYQLSIALQQSTAVNEMVMDARTMRNADDTIGQAGQRGKPHMSSPVSDYVGVFGYSILQHQDALRRLISILSEIGNLVLLDEFRFMIM